MYCFLLSVPFSLDISRFLEIVNYLSNFFVIMHNDSFLCIAQLSTLSNYASILVQEGCI